MLSAAPSIWLCDLNIMQCYSFIGNLSTKFTLLKNITERKIFGILFTWIIPNSQINHCIQVSLFDYKLFCMLSILQTLEEYKKSTEEWELVQNLGTFIRYA